MSRTVAEIAAQIAEVTQPGFRGQLLARGLARNLIWSRGKIPDGGQNFSPLLTSDLLSYGIALLSLGLELRDQDPTNSAAVRAFERSAEAIESVIRDGDPEDNERGFYTVLAAAAYHLGHFSARAFSLFPSELQGLNLSPAERTFTQLLRRDLAKLREELLTYAGESGFDQTLSEELEKLGGEAALENGIYLTLNSLYHRALATFDYGIEAGSPNAIQASQGLLAEGAAAAEEYASVPFWWIFTLTRHLLDDLWSHSLHVRLPFAPDDSKWVELRRLFIAKLIRQDRSEIELWPSQLEAAARAIDVKDDLVAALPTSAGKTRIAELCILRALSLGKRVVFVTPLRALSAQTERSLRQTFTALGFSVSSLYGSSGTIGDDADSLQNRTIVVSTPEKLDFALRNNASLLDDVGLIVFDEAHTIGAGEREIRYEVLVQRLLRRSDAADRRIVCLSAILPQGEQLDDFLSWMRQDQPGKGITVDWRPTRQRFGEIIWQSNPALTEEGDLSGNSATLTFRLDDIGHDDAPYVGSFVVSVKALGQQRKPLPRDRRDLCLMSAWKLVSEGQTVLLYCPERRSVMPLARTVIDLVRRGYLTSLLDCPPESLGEALSIGREWLGEHHPAVQCLQMGVAVHHGQLPRPFLRAIERLLKNQLLKVTIASPTLAQGLNLSATSVLFTSLTRSGDTIRGEEFANVAGRAGRAFVDVEGQVLCAAWEPKHQRQWNRLLLDARERNLKSGLLQLIIDFCNRIAINQEVSLTSVLEYVLGNADVWSPPKAKTLETEDDEDQQAEFERRWNADLACLDTAILSLVQHDVPLADLAKAIDEALKGSLWERSLRRETEYTQTISKLMLGKRAEQIWKSTTPVQRKGYFFAGVGLTTGKFLDLHSDDLLGFLLAADLAFASGSVPMAVEALVAFATIAFAIEPFKPKEELRENWVEVLKAWVSAESMADLAGDHDEELLEFIEDALVYRLVWAMEAVRVRITAEYEDIEWPNSGRAATALETGTADYCAALLIQNGLASRVAAIKAVSDCPAGFTDLAGLRQWVRSDEVRQHESDTDWPTRETASLWRTFVGGLAVASMPKWSSYVGKVKVEWFGEALPSGTEVRLLFSPDKKRMKVYTADLDPVGSLPYGWPVPPSGIALGTVDAEAGFLEVTYLGPADFFSN